MKRHVLLVIAVLSVGWGLLLMSLAPNRSAPRAAPVPIVTNDEFDRIEMGMTYEQCVAIIGAPGTPYGSSGEPGRVDDALEWITYRWRNQPGSYAHVSFHFGRVGRKHAVNLK